MSVKRKSDLANDDASVKKQLKVIKAKSEKDSGNKVLKTNSPDVSNPKVKKVKTEKHNEGKENSAEIKKQKNRSSPNFKKNKKSTGQELTNNGEKKMFKNENSTGKKESALERREKKRKLKSERQSKKKKDETVVDLGTKAKHVWNKVRAEDCPENEREKLLNELHGLVKGNLNKVIQAHDTVRVVECLMAKGSEQIRNAIYDELKDDLVNIAKSKYGTFFVQKLLSYGTKEQKERVVKTFEGKIAELTRHKIANAVVDSAYNDVATTGQQTRYLQEFFGPEFRVCKEEDLKTAVDIAKKYPKKEATVRRALAENCNILISKGCYNQTIVHSVLNNYMQLLNYIIANQQNEKNDSSMKEESKEHKEGVLENSENGKEKSVDYSNKAKTARSELISQLRDVCVHILHSQDGARLAMNALWHGSAKDRKAIIKSFKTFVPKICGEQYGHMVLLAAFDCVDDTKLLSKAIVGEIIGDGKDEDSNKIAEIFGSEKAGRKVLLYLLVGRDTTYFSPELIAQLKLGDGNEHSKKEDSTRRNEILKSIEDRIYKFLNENLDEILKDDSKCSIFIKAALNCTGVSNEHVKPLLEKLSDIASEKFEVGSDNFVESAAGHMLLKKVIAHDKVRNAEGLETFSQKLLSQLKEKKTMESYIKCNRGAFVLVTMMQTDIPDLQKSVKDAMKSYKSVLKSQKIRGAEVLSEKLKDLK